MNCRVSQLRLHLTCGGRVVRAVVLAFAVLVVGSVVARAQTETVLYSFGGAPDGAGPSGLVSDSSGDLFGTTGAGGLSSSLGGAPCFSGCGTVFELIKSSSGYTERVLYSFTDSTGIGDGDTPSSGLIMDAAGNLYGETRNGSTSGAGTVFEMEKTSTGYSYHLLHAFSSNTSDGFGPGGDLVMDSAGDLFGTTGAGGTNNFGTVFELVKSTTGYTEKVLYSFPSANVGINQGLVMDASGDLFGTTPNGGTTAPTCLNGCGAVFELANSSGTYTYKTLYNFTGPGGDDGALPEDNLVIDGSGNLYGTTNEGGSACAPYGCGTVFQLAKGSRGYTEKVLYSFTAGEPAPYDEGMQLSMDATGDFFGTSLTGSTTSGSGSAFELVKSASGYAEKVLWNFQGTPVDGGSPCSVSMMDSLGHLYGTCSDGGAQEAGDVFEIDPGATPTGVTLSPVSVSFPTQLDGTTGVVQTVRLTNNTSSAVTISGISVTGPNAKDFPLGESLTGTNCWTASSTWATGSAISTVPAGGMCAILPIFTPSIAGNETATLAVTDSAGTETSALTGTGFAPNFTLGLGPGSSSGSTVSPGQKAGYWLSVAPVGGFNHTVTFTCSGAPSEATCTVGPSSVTLDGSKAQLVYVIVTTTAASLTTPPVVPPHANRPAWPFLLAVLVLISLISFYRLQNGRFTLKPSTMMRLRRAVLVATLFGMAALAACGSGVGGGGGSGSGASSNPATPAGSYTLTVTGTSGSLTHSTTLTLTVN